MTDRQTKKRAVVTAPFTHEYIDLFVEVLYYMLQIGVFPYFIT